MKKLLALVTLAAVFCAAPAFASDPIVGTWKLNVEKSKFGGEKVTAGTRVYSESGGVYTLDQKVTGADGKEKSMSATYADGKEEKQPMGGIGDTIAVKKINDHTWD